MSTEIGGPLEGISLTRYAGPANETSRTRARIQVTNEHRGEYVTFSYEQWETLRYLVNTYDVWAGIKIANP